ncbi:MAG: respiratory nitrate reductase subunit gamma [Deltaproteobacteria bacterium]|nr:respiratory nitrate reductase subunit gamma [Deltaproteobacteria bacterium]
MRPKLILVLILLAAVTGTTWGAGPAEATWLIDGQRFYKAHGEQTCLDCHKDKADDAKHPDPAKVTRTLKEIFEPGHCYECHGEVESNLAKGKHGKREVTDVEAYQACLRCHNPHYLGPRDKSKDEPAKEGAKPAAITPTKGAEKCYQCHVYNSGAQGQQPPRTVEFCGSCHFTDARKDGVKLRFNPADLANGPHTKLDCLTCHPMADRFPHNQQEIQDCRTCHATRHPEKTAHDAHIGVTCVACHVDGVTPERKYSGPIKAHAQTPPAGGLTKVHHLLPAAAETSCQRCHTAGNQVGAAAMVLPAKSIICMPCHTATFSVRDTTTVVALIIFVIGFLGAGSFWLSGRKATNHQQHFTPPDCKLTLALEAFFYDGLLQRRLWVLSPERALIHSLIFWPFIIRCLWGLVALVTTTFLPEQNWVWPMIDKNHPLTALVFDLTGLMVLAGVALALIRRWRVGRQFTGPNWPRPDWVAMGLLLGIIVIGFITEAMRIAMTGTPTGASWAVFGYILSHLFTPGPSLQAAYGYIWHIHAILTGIFAAYLPFSRMFHMILAPVVLAIRAAQGQHH